MNWTHCSKGAVLAVLLAVSLLAVGTAAAVTVTGDAPAATAEGESVTASATLEEPFRDAPDQWTLQGETDLGNATWRIQVISQGEQIDTVTVDGDTVSYQLTRDTGATTVEIEVTGTVPEMAEFDYLDPSVENYTAVGLSGEGIGSDMLTFDAARYTAVGDDEVGSQEARAAIDSAIEAVGERNDKIDQAISSYDNGNFENAVELAEEAEEGAQSGQLLMIGAGVVVLLVLVGGGYYYWKSRQDTGYKLQ